MKITYDPNKNLRNIEERGLSFELAHYFEWDSAIIVPDTRKNYPEKRFLAAGYLENSDRLHILVFTPIIGGFRVISFRKANKREIKKYENSGKTTY